MSARPSLRKTALHNVHLRMGARMAEFAGWEIPLHYSGIVDEHRAVRSSVGVFDVSHMGEIEVEGPGAAELVDFVATNAVGELEAGRIHYTGLLYAHGGFVDDVLVHRTGDQSFFLCVNALNTEKVFEHIRSANRWGARVEQASDRYAQIAIQGPKAEQVLQPLCEAALAELRYYWFVDTQVAGKAARVARTGYTGEKGFEVYVAPENAELVWDRVLDAGQAFGARPCGLGARNTLRLEAGMALYGHEIDASTTPLEAGLERVVRMDKGEFLGREALARQLAGGVRRKLTGFVMLGREVARDGYVVQAQGRPVGWVTSGAPSPTLGKNIGFCYLPSELAEPGTRVEVVIRGKPAAAEIVRRPFYKRVS